jgi:hypothetical protein
MILANASRLFSEDKTIDFVEGSMYRYKVGFPEGDSEKISNSL